MEREKITRQAENILAKMTIQQKLGQITGMFGGGDMPVDVLNYMKDGVGALSFLPATSSKEENYELIQKEQEIVMKNCNIPVLRHNEALTGQMTADSTVFPSAIGLGATWDTEIVQDMADTIRKQMVAEGTRHALSPVMDVARDPRWGRVGETYGEDPTLCAAMSVAFVKGMQSEDLKDGVLATGKHFLGYAAGEGGLNMSASPISARELREVYAKPFQAAISEAELGSIMNSYGVIDNELVIGSGDVLTKLLREELGFDGVVVSDYMSINKMVELKTSSSPENAAAEAIKAGLDMELPVPYGVTEKLIPIVEENSEVSEALDRAVTKVLEAKLKLGLFENPGGRKEWMDSYDRAATRPLTLKAARESIVLLKNKGVLPLEKKKQKIALIGPHMDSMRLLFGCYTYPAAFDRDVVGAMGEMPGLQNIAKNSEDSPYKMPYLPGSKVRGTSPYVEEQLKKHYKGVTPTILEAVQNACPMAEIRCEKGCDIAGNGREGFDAALAVAEWADIVIVAGGGKYGWGTSCTSGEGIDSDRIGLPGVQEELAQLIIQKTKENSGKAVFVHMDSKPLSSEMIVSQYDAVLENWFPGDTGGTALAEVLFGEYNPAGRLPMTAVRNAGQIPVYASQRNGSGYRPAGMTIAKYIEGTIEPLHEFGYGLSYTEFKYSDLEITPEISANGEVEVAITVENCGDRDGDEVVQLYVTDELASMIRPAQELAGFCRVSLRKGEKKRIYFRMRANQFAFLDKNMKWLVEAGTMTVKIGASSKDIRKEGQFTITDSAHIDGKTRGFYAKCREEDI